MQMKEDFTALSIQPVDGRHALESDMDIDCLVTLIALAVNELFKVDTDK